MAFSAVSCFAGLECLGAVVTLAAILACIHVCHGVLATLLHRKDLGMAVIALQALVCMGLAIEHNLACTTAFVLNGLSGRHCKRAAHKCYDNEQSNKQYCLFHLFTPFPFMRFCFLTEEKIRISASHINAKTMVNNGLLQLSLLPKSSGKRIYKRISHVCREMSRGFIDAFAFSNLTVVKLRKIFRRTSCLIRLNPA